ncbi:MAG: ABC transporter ATP-binding protein, partial [Sneathiella sp.]
VAFGLKYRQDNPLKDSGEIQKNVRNMLDLVGLSDLENRRVGQLSGGQKQRVSLARTLVCQPKICLLDEPLGALDANLRERMAIELRRIREALQVTFLHVTGNETEALAMGDRVVVLNKGQICQIDKPSKVFATPSSTEVARFVNAYNLFPGEGLESRFSYYHYELPYVGDASRACYYGIRYDQMKISADKAGEACLTAKFITSEFEGARIKYFFERPDTGVFEAEMHLGEGDPMILVQGEKYRVSWNPEDALLFDISGSIMNDSNRTEALQ